MKAGLAAAGLTDNVEFQIDQRGLTVKLIGSQAFFAADRPELTDRASQVLQIISPILGPAALELMVEGHAANGITLPVHLGAVLGPGGQRAALHGGPRRDPPGHGSGRSRSAPHGRSTDDSTPELMERTRPGGHRGDFGQPDVVRALIPEAMKLTQK